LVLGFAARIIRSNHGLSTNRSTKGQRGPSVAELWPAVDVTVKANPKITVEALQKTINFLPNGC